MKQRSKKTAGKFELIRYGNKQNTGFGIEMQRECGEVSFMIMLGKSRFRLNYRGKACA